MVISYYYDNTFWETLSRNMARRGTGGGNTGYGEHQMDPKWLFSSDMDLSLLNNEREGEDEAQTTGDPETI